MVLMPIYFEEFTITSLTWPLCSPYLDNRSYPGSHGEDQTCYFMESLATSPSIGNGQSKYSPVLGSAWKTAHYIKSCMCSFTPTIAMFMFFSPSVRVGVLPPTLYILYMERCPFPCGICLSSVASPLLVRFMTRPFLVHKSLAIGTSKIKQWSLLPVDSCLLLLGA